MELLLRATHKALFVTIVITVATITIVPTANSEDLSFLTEEKGDSLEDLEVITNLQRAKTGERESFCVREKRLKKVGISVTGEVLIIDVGRCRKRRLTKKRLKRTRFQKLLRQNPDIDPVKLFLLNSPRHQSLPSCPRGKLCIGVDSRREMVFTSNGELSVDIIERCSCQRKPKLCRREPKIEIFHKGTPLESFIDVGQCQGGCAEATKCKPLVQKTVSLKGPNGAECVTVIEDCTCAHDCYRLSHYEQFYDYVEESPRIKVVDIGQCMGDCSQTRKGHCILRAEDDAGGCVASLTQSASECLPVSLLDNAITDEDGDIRNITSISSCGCR